MREKNIDVILAGAADHRQYLTQDTASIEDEEFNRYRQMAREEGFALTNPTTFFIQHVYATVIGQL